MLIVVSYLWWWNYEWLLFSSLYFYILAKFSIMSILSFGNCTNYLSLNFVSPKWNCTCIPSYVSFHCIFTRIGSRFGRPNVVWLLWACVYNQTSVGLRLCLDSRLEHCSTHLFTGCFPVGEVGGHRDRGDGGAVPGVLDMEDAVTTPPPPAALPQSLPPLLCFLLPLLFSWVLLL